jgi:hypothetical protein
MITTLFIIAGAIIISAVSFMVYSVLRAPDGYEDVAGFHSSIEIAHSLTPVKSKKDRAIRAHVRLSDVQMHVS